MTKEEKVVIGTWKSILVGTLLGAPTAMAGSLVSLSFRFCDSQAFMLFFFFPVWGLFWGAIIGFFARKPSKKHPERSWKKRLGKGLLILAIVSFIIGIPMVI